MGIPVVNLADFLSGDPQLKQKFVNDHRRPRHRGLGRGRGPLRRLRGRGGRPSPRGGGARRGARRGVRALRRSRRRVARDRAAVARAGGDHGAAPGTGDRSGSTRR